MRTLKERHLNECHRVIEDFSDKKFSKNRNVFSSSFPELFGFSKMMSRKTSFARILNLKSALDRTLQGEDVGMSELDDGDCQCCLNGGSRTKK